MKSNQTEKFTDISSCATAGTSTVKMVLSTNHSPDEIQIHESICVMTKNVNGTSDACTQGNIEVKPNKIENPGVSDVTIDKPSNEITASTTDSSEISEGQTSQADVILVHASSCMPTKNANVTADASTHGDIEVKPSKIENIGVSSGTMDQVGNKTPPYTTGSGEGQAGQGVTSVI